MTEAPSADQSHPDAWAKSPSGLHWTIRHGEWEATLVEVGGGLRTLTHAGTELVAGFGVDEAIPSGRGQQLMPWPNRIRDGRYRDGEVEQQLPITEVAKHNASHGLVRWAPWTVIEQATSEITLGCRLHPSPGWTHPLDLRTSYRLDDSGLIVTPSVRNVGPDDAPFGYGAHPYLAIGATPIADVTLQVPAAAYVEVDERSLPVDVRPVGGTRFDFRAERLIGGEELDTAYTEISANAGDGWRVVVRSEVGAVNLWADAAFPWLQVFTGVAHQGKGIPGVAVEPMTCPADAFNYGRDLIRLAPGERWSGTWGIGVA